MFDIFWQQLLEYDPYDDVSLAIFLCVLDLDLVVDIFDQGSPTMLHWAYVAAKINGQLWCF